MTGVLFLILRTLASLQGLSMHGFVLLLETTLKGTLFLVLAAALTLALRRASAAARHLIWLLALGSMLALPILSLIVPAWDVAIIPQARSDTAGVQTLIGEDFETPLRNNQVQPHHPASWLAPASPVNRTGCSAWIGCILYVWAIGAMLVAARTAVGEVRVRRLAGRSSCFETSRTKSILENVRRRLSISRPVELRISAEVAIPFTRGTFRPSVLLPAEARGWSQKYIEFVFAHELAHVSRFDPLTQMLAQIACALFWFHPLVWHAALEMCKERERACDDIVLSFDHPPTDYAELLLKLGRTLSRLDSAWSTRVAMAQSSQLEVRMKALLDSEVDRRPLAANRILLATVLVVVVLLPTAAIRATAKNAMGNISGTVHDPSGAVIPSADVNLINRETKTRLFVQSGEDGSFDFPALPPGGYRLEITKPGFASVESGDIELKPASNLNQDITMNMGDVIQNVTVLAHKSGENRPTPPPAPRRIRVGGNIQAAHLVFEPRPVYPPNAQKQGIEGIVILRAVIGTSGQILSLSPFNDVDPDLTQAAMSAVRQWRYQPTLLNGVPVEVVTTIEVTFQLGN